MESEIIKPVSFSGRQFEQVPRDFLVVVFAVILFLL